MQSSDKNKLIDKINTAFANIGRSNGTKLPSSKDNREPIAWELFIAQHVNALANKRKEQAEKAAIASGVIINKDTNPQPEGTNSLMYSGDHVNVMLKVSSSALRVDVDKLITYLTQKGVDPRLLETARMSASTKNRPAHVFSTVLLTED